MASWTIARDKLFPPPKFSNAAFYFFSYAAALPHPTFIPPPPRASLLIHRVSSIVERKENIAEKKNWTFEKQKRKSRGEKTALGSNFSWSRGVGIAHEGWRKKRKMQAEFLGPVIKGGEGRQSRKRPAHRNYDHPSLSPALLIDAYPRTRKEKKKCVDDEDDATFWILIKALSFSKVYLCNKIPPPQPTDTYSH